ncbi:hypothetical protein CLAIMM_10018 [Cladophialophora immunda]|nr:hypothetical protein CLAIMM_10018 [Cladophialophora immunda]
MTALCGYNNGDFSRFPSASPMKRLKSPWGHQIADQPPDSPVACSSGFGCVQWQFPGVFGCTSGASTILPTTCVEMEEQGATPTVGVIACHADTPYCATISLYWSDYFYTHWECNTRAADPITILATPTITGDGGVSTRYLNAAFSASGEASSTATSSGGSGGNGDTSKGSGSNSSNIGAIIGAIAGVVAAVAAIGLWICTKHHFHKQRQYEVQRDQNIGHSRDLVVRRNHDMMSVAGEIERGRPVNVYVNELHYHDHTGRGGPLRLNG